MMSWIVETLVATSLLMLLVLALRAPVRRAFGPNIAYALWALPLIRLVLPPLPGVFGLNRLVEPVVDAQMAHGVAFGVMDPARLPAPIAAQAIPAQIDIAGAAPLHLAIVPPVATDAGPSWLILAAAIWAVGALVFFGWHLVAHGRFCRRLLAQASVRRPLAQGRVWMVESDAASGPLAFGIWRKYVAFPRDFDARYDAVERNLAIAHELGHHARGDLLANWAALLMLALHWFNPIAWRAFRAFRADQEMACDALVLADRPQALRHAYGRAIVKSAHGGAVSAACHLHTINEIKGRLRMLTVHTRPSRRRLAAGAGAAALLTLAGLGLTASGTHAAEAVRAKVERGTGVKLDALDAEISDAADQVNAAVQAVDAPPPPVAPAAPGDVDAPARPDAPLPPPPGAGTPVHRAPPVAPVPPVAVTARVAPVPPAPPVPPAGAHAIRREVRILRQPGARTNVEVRVHADGDAAARVAADIPDIRSLRCGPGDRTVTETNGPGGRRRLVICTDRIERQAAVAARAQGDAQAMRRTAMAHAMIGLEHARRTIEATPNMTDAQRREALRGLDDAAREMRREMADAD